MISRHLFLFIIWKNCKTMRLTRVLADVNFEKRRYSNEHLLLTVENSGSGSIEELEISDGKNQRTADDFEDPFLHATVSLPFSSCHEYLVKKKKKLDYLLWRNLTWKWKSFFPTTFRFRTSDYIYIYIWIFEKKKKIERFSLYEISRIRYFIFLFLRNFLLWKNPTLFPRKYKYKYINNIFDRKGGKEIAIKKKIGHNGAPLNSWTPLDRSAWQDRSRDAPPSPLFLKLRQRCWIGEEKYSYTGTVHNYAVISFSLFFFLPTISSYLRTTTLPKTYLHTRGE